MAKQTVNIELRASGGTKVAGEMGKIGKASTDLVVNIKKIGGAFGELGGFFGDLFSNIMKGGIWGIMSAAVQGVIKLFGKMSSASEEAEQKAAEAARNAHSERMAEIREYSSALDKLSEKRKAQASLAIKLNNDEIASWHSLARASLEAERAMARAAGDKNGVSAIDRELAEVDAESRRRQLQEQIRAAKQAKIDADKEWREAYGGRGQARRYRDRLVDEYSGKAMSKKAWDAADKNLEDARAEVAKYQSKMDKAAEAGKKAISDRKKAEAELEALELKEVARKANAEMDAKEKAEAEDKKAAEEREKAEIAAAQAAEERQKAEIAAAQAAAKERERLDREAHQKRMADLRAEIAEQTRSAGSLKAVAASAQSEFDKAFAMYRDPSRAAAVIGEEQDYRNDLDRLHKDARRYGGKWRIDELSSLMAAGDTHGVSDTLASWRKNKSFTPEVEAMVRASAAEKTKTTAEDELRKVNAELERLSSSMESLASERNSKLGDIERNTSGLAAKVDELLSVKG